MFALYNWELCNLASKDFSIKKNLVAGSKQGVYNSENILFFVLRVIQLTIWLTWD